MSSATIHPIPSSVAIEDVTGLKERSLVQKLVSSQPFWVTIALIAMVLGMTWYQPEAFASADNFFNITRNFAFIGIMAIGMTAVILTGGIDLSVGSIMGLAGVVCGLVLQAEGHWVLAILAGLLSGVAVGVVNGVLISYVGLPAFVVTLGMLSGARSLAVVLSENKMIYEFGPWGDTFNAIGGGSIFGIANPVWVLLVLAILFSIILNFTELGQLSLRHRKQ